MIGVCPINVCPVNILPINIDTLEICKYIKIIINKMFEIKSHFTKEYTCCVGQIYSYIENNDIVSTISNINDHNDQAIKEAVSNLHKILHNTYAYISHYTEKTHIKCINYKVITTHINKHYEILRKRMEIYKFSKIGENTTLLEQLATKLNERMSVQNHVQIGKCVCDNFDQSHDFFGEILVNHLDDIKFYDFDGSVIKSAELNGIHLGDQNYNAILREIYNTIFDGVTIIKNSKLLLKTLNVPGHHYIESIGIGIPTVNNNKLIDEIMSQCTINKIKLTLKIQLANDCKLIIQL